MSALRTRLLAALPVLAGAAWLFGLAWRYQHLLVSHPMTQFVYSDMQSYRDAALHFADPSYEPKIADTLFPPGAGYFYSLLYRIDPSWELAKWTMFVLSSAVPLLIGAIAFVVFDAAVASVSIITASLYFHFIDFFGFFLSEGPFIVALLVGMLLLCSSLRTAGRRRAWAMGFAAGVSFAAAASMRSVALAWIALFGLVVLVWRVRHRRRGTLAVALAMLLGVGVILAPVGARCTRLNEGRLCAVSTNAGMNMLLGHLPFGRAVHWHDRARGIHHTFGSPPSSQRALFKRELNVDFGAYDAENQAKFLQLAKADPLGTVAVSLDQVFNLFSGTVPWPSSHTDWYRSSLVTEQAFVVFLLLPALWPLRRRIAELVRLDPRAAPETLLALPLVGMMAVSFATLGEPRYRIPLDGFTMILAASEWVRALRGRDGRRLSLE
jgi:hypothetical protein